MLTVLCEMMNLGSWSVKQSLNCGHNGLSPYSSRASNAPDSVWGLAWLKVIIGLEDTESIGVIVGSP